ncbi:metal-dependent transcriptional regulator [Macrococcoides caseolyticum]|uniref:metal-dependent transcriptional regulator n=1 Tax=Macrococcoides caseolyticum TaxID=69966 RepID=UPI001F1BBC1A|nr:metal-dependent transcriptional regulator [Macrococcus caseolyticus]MCE4956552.1 metal-dependent transcriptional regulator [Macrococcus caseolyticus]
MLTEEKEDYLKIIYYHKGKDHFVSNKIIANALSIKPPSVSEMMTRLEKEALVEIKPYKGVKLTQQGMKEVVRLLKRHRLIECFLIESLKYNWDEVHAEAEVLEHKVSDMFIERLDEMLGYPEYCPHGAKIPRDEHIEEFTDSILELNERQTFTLKQVEDEAALLKYLSEHHVKVSDTLTITKKDESNKILYIQKDNDEFVLSYENASKLYY